MSVVVKTPVELLEAVAKLRLPSCMDQRLQELKDRKTNGDLTDTEREELQTLVDWSERIARICAHAILVLGRKPT